MFVSKPTLVIGGTIAFVLGLGIGLGRPISGTRLLDFAFYYSPIHQSLLIHGSWRAENKLDFITQNTTSLECKHATMECVGGNTDAIIRNVLGSSDTYIVNMENGGFQSFTLVAQGIGSQWYVV